MSITKKDIYKIVAIPSSSSAHNFGALADNYRLQKEMAGESIGKYAAASLDYISKNQTKGQSGESKSLKLVGYWFPIFISSLLLLLAGVFLFLGIHFGLVPRIEGWEFVFYTLLILAIASIIAAFILGMVYARFTKKFNKTIEDNQKVVAKITGIMHGTKYAATTRNSGGPLVIIITYEYNSPYNQNNSKPIKVNVKFPKKDESNFHIDKEFPLLISKDDRLHLFLK